NESNHIVIKDQELGKRHAKIKSFQGKVEIFDLGSKSGIYVNEIKLEFRASHTLEKDDRITLGKVILQYLPAGEYENRTDKLLPIYNKAYLLTSLEEAFTSARDKQEDLSLIFFDIDHFKHINDEYTHDAGDYVLKELAKLVQTLIRPEDIFARYGGEKFTILLKNKKSELAFESAEKIRKAIESHEFIYNGKRLSVTVSFGIADMNSSVESHEDLLKRADDASYVAKRQGRNRVKIWTKEIDSVGKEIASNCKEIDSNGKESDSNSKGIGSNDYLEIFSRPTYFPTNKKTIQHDKLPSVTNELSVTFQLNLKRHSSNWITIFHKGEDAQQARTPALWLTPNDSQPCLVCSVNSNWNKNVLTETRLELNKWYHIVYTLSEPQKCMELYVNSKLIGSIDTKEIKFNEFPLKIGHSGTYTDFQGQMSNFRYYNIRLSTDEIFKDYISYLRNQVKIWTKEIGSNSEDAQQARTPALWLTPNNSQPCPVCSVNSNWNKNVRAETRIELNKWYHIAYTLSEPQKCMELY
ncbi:7813_t:CDS:2, partial [Racocetra persica]